MQVLNFKKIGKGYLVGGFDLVLNDFGGLTIYGCTFFEKDGRAWISFPSREYEKDGKKKYFSYVKFEPKMMQQIEENALKMLKNELSAPVENQFTPPVAQQQSFFEVPF